MNLEDMLLRFILENPGSLKSLISDRFSLSDYRLNRALRHIARNLDGSCVKCDPVNGVWIVETDPKKCLGLEWLGFDRGGFRQCCEEPAFPDGRCYHHSDAESLELTAFKRRLSYLIGPCDPKPWSLTQLPLHTVEELFQTLRRISPITQKEFDNRLDLLRVIVAARAWLKWKDQLRKRGTEGRIPPEFEQRHKASSINSFEYSIRKYYLILEITPESTKEEALKSWKRLARLHHPDASSGTGGNEEKMKQINYAKDRIFRYKRWD